jgi:hypothetical protein
VRGSELHRVADRASRRGRQGQPQLNVVRIECRAVFAGEMRDAEGVNLRLRRG